jgi:hypothetical protein
MATKRKSSGDDAIVWTTYEFAAWVDGRHLLEEDDYFDFGDPGEVITIIGGPHGHYIVGTIKGRGLEDALVSMIENLRLPITESDMNVEWFEILGTARL